ncbi:MAG: methyltransferase domain-containing protein, partial [Verrucomicrobiota bacterium]
LFLMAVDPNILPPEMKAAVTNRGKHRSWRDSFLLLLLSIRGNRYTTKALVDLYFKIATPFTYLNLWRLRWFPKNYASPVKINLGSGPQYLPGFLNIEGMFAWKKDLWIDVRQGLPFKNGSVDVIYSCHVFEHFDLDTLRRIMRECYRVLKPGGHIRIVTPSLAKAIEAYQRKDLAWFAKGADSPLKSMGARFNDLMLCQNHHLVLPDFDFFEELFNDIGPWEKLWEGNAETSTALTHEELALAESSRKDVINSSLILEGRKAGPPK